MSLGVGCWWCLQLVEMKIGKYGPEASRHMREACGFLWCRLETSVGLNMEGHWVLGLALPVRCFSVWNSEKFRHSEFHLGLPGHDEAQGVNEMPSQTDFYRRPTHKVSH